MSGERPIILNMTGKFVSSVGAYVIQPFSTFSVAVSDAVREVRHEQTQRLVIAAPVHLFETLDSRQAALAHKSLRALPTTCSVVFSSTADGLTPVPRSSLPRRFWRFVEGNREQPGRQL
jgi:hypothetical protein